MMKKADRPWFGWVLGLLITFLGGLFLALGPGRGALDRLSFDLPLPGHHTHVPSEAVLVYLNDSDYTALGQPLRLPLSRTNHAALIRALRIAGARLIVFDLLFHDPDPVGDPYLLSAFQERPDVVIGAKELKGEWLLPLESYRSNAFMGHCTFRPDEDDGIRRMPSPLWTDDNLEVPALAAAAVKALGSNLPPVGSRHYLHYYGPPEDLPHTNYFGALNVGAGSALFANKVVFVGRKQTTTADSANTDMHPTPYTRTGLSDRAAGVAIHATAFLNLLHHEPFVRAPGWVITVLFLLIAGGAGAGLTMMPPRTASLVALSAAAVLVAAGYTVARSWHVWFPWATLVVELGIALAWAIFYNGYRSHLERQLLRQSIGKHLSPSRVNQILRHPEALRPGGEMREVSLMFTDIAGFSKVAQRKHPEDLVKLLNGYYEEAIAAVHVEDGVVMDLIGDSIFALWNAPEVQSDHRARACRTALALHQRVLNFDKSNEGAPLRTRVGLHCGTVCVGNVGSTQRFDYTAIGDAVNLASRLEGLNKQLGTDILATREIQRTVEQELATRRVGQFRFKGFDKVVEVYELIGPAAPEAAWLVEFRTALHHFQRRAWAEAEAGFRRVLTLRPHEHREGEPGDGPSHFYLKQVEFLRANPPPDEWLGEVDLREK